MAERKKEIRIGDDQRQVNTLNSENTNRKQKLSCFTFNSYCASKGLHWLGSTEKNTVVLLWRNVHTCPDAVEQKQNRHLSNIHQWDWHVNHRGKEKTYHFAMLHQFNGVIDLVQGHVVSDELIQLHLLVHVGFNHLRHTILTLKS